LLAVELLAGTIDIAVHIEGVEVTIGGKASVILVVKHDFSQCRLARRQGDGTGQGHRQQG